jgi:hypothetical protein
MSLPRIRHWNNAVEPALMLFLQMSDLEQRRMLEWWDGINPYTRLPLKTFTPRWYAFGKREGNWLAYRSVLMTWHQVQPYWSSRRAEYDERVSRIGSMVGEKIQIVLSGESVEFFGRAFEPLPRRTIESVNPNLEHACGVCKCVLERPRVPSREDLMCQKHPNEVLEFAWVDI